MIRVFLSSADWMDRNFFRRIEVAFPVLEKTLRQRVIDEGLRPYLEDNTHAWTLHRDGTYRRLTPGRRSPRSAQHWLMNKLVTSTCLAFDGPSPRRHVVFTSSYPPPSPLSFSCVTCDATVRTAESHVMDSQKSDAPAANSAVSCVGDCPISTGLPAPGSLQTL